MNGAGQLDAFQHNERVKAFSSSLGNLGVGMLGAEAALIYTGKGDDYSILFAFLGLMMILMAGGMTIFLRAQD